MSAAAVIADALGDGTAVVEDGGLDGVAPGTVEERKDAAADDEAAADDVDAVAAAEMVEDEVSCRLDGRTGEEWYVGITSTIAGGGGIN